jgi:hypothetical protein
MVVLWVIAGAFVLAGLMVLLAKVLDRLVGTDPSEPFAGWYRGRTSDRSQSGGFKGSEYDSMNDHGNRDADGGL